MAKPVITIGPGAAVGLGALTMAVSGYSQQLWQWLELITGADPKSEPSQAQLVKHVNNQLNSSMAQMKDFVKKEARARRGMVHVLDSTSAYMNPVFLLKLLCVGGVAYGAMRIFGYGIEDLLFVTRYKISKRLESLEGTIKFIQDDVERRFKELAGSLAYYKEELQDMHDGVTDSIEEMDREVVGVREKVTTVSSTTGRMESRLGSTSQGIQMLCQVVAENFPNSAAQQGLRAFAHNSLPGPEEMERGDRLLLPRQQSTPGGRFKSYPSPGHYPGPEAEGGAPGRALGRTASMPARARGRSPKTDPPGDAQE